MENIGTSGTPERPRFQRLTDMVREYGEPAPPLVDGLLPDKRLIALTGKPFTGKSLLTLDIADSIARGEKVFGSVVAGRYGSVLYLDMKDGADEISRRLHQRGYAIGSELAPLYIHTGRVVLSGSGATSRLETIIESMPGRPVLIVVDPAIEALGINNWLDSSEIVDKFRPLREFAHNNCTVLLPMFTRKGAEELTPHIEGNSSAFLSSVDGWIHIYKADKTEEGHRRLHLSIRGKGAMRGERVVQMDTKTLRFSYVGDNAQQGGVA